MHSKPNAIFVCFGFLSLWSAVLTVATVACSAAFAGEPTKWVTIPSGRFLMGSHVPADQIAKDYEKYRRPAEYFRDEFPAHTVEITRPFMIAATEVTVGQFRAFVEETGYVSEAERDGTGGWGYDKAAGKCIGRDRRYSWRDAGYPQTDAHPVVNVSWGDCQAYCAWLSKKENRRVRLPTEAEWEYACRAGTRTYYATGDTPDSVLNGARTLAPTETSIRHAVQDLLIAEETSTTFPVPVGSYAPNRFGLHDMHGNVWEWTSDWHDDTYYAHSPSQDPQGPPQGEVKVRRGGGWNTFPLWSRASFRNWNSPDSRCINLGFRVVGDLNPLEIDAYEKAQPIRILFVGDIMLDGGPGNAVQAGVDPFAPCASTLADADLTIGNLECVLGRGGEMILKNYSFRGASRSPEFLKKHFDGLSLANNHSWDFGADGIVECMQVLRNHNIAYFGAGADIDAARRGWMVDVRGRKVLFLGYNDFRWENYRATKDTAGSAPMIDDDIVADIQAAKRERGADIVIPFVHWGEEMVSMPRPSQRERARRWIDAGADAVIGTHAHVTQTTDVYRGAPIVYSLGNFVFDYFPVDPPMWTGWMVRLVIPPSGPIDLETIAVELDPIGIPHVVVTDEDPVAVP